MVLSERVVFLEKVFRELRFAVVDGHVVVD